MYENNQIRDLDNDKRKILAVKGVYSKKTILKHYGYLGHKPTLF